MCECWYINQVSKKCFNQVGKSLSLSHDSCQSYAADRWNSPHARLHHGITLICLCHSVALDRLNYPASVSPASALGPFIFSHLILSFPIQLERPHICLVLFGSDSIPSQTAILHPIQICYVSATIYLTLHPSLCLDCFDAAQKAIVLIYLFSV